MARISREMVITEKLDGTNASILIAELANDAPIPVESLGLFDIGGKLHYMLAGSRTRWITPEKRKDNAGFAAWVERNFDVLKELGPGHHFGEWWGQGIQRGYGLGEKRFSLFNTIRWCRHNDTPLVTGERWDEEAKAMVPMIQTPAPKCCHVVPTIYHGCFDTVAIDTALRVLEREGSIAAPGFMNPEGVIAYHIAGRVGFKKTLGGDGAKGEGK